MIKDRSAIMAAAERRSNRLVQRFCQRREQLRTRRGHAPAVLQADAELTRDVYSRLVRKAHSRLQRRGIAVHQVGRLVAVEPDAMAGAMRETRQLVTGAPTLALIIATHRVVDAAHRYTDLRGLESDFLAALDRIPDLALALVRPADDPAAGNVGLVSLHRAAAVHEDDRTLAHRLNFHRPMRIGRGFVQEHH